MAGLDWSKKRVAPEQRPEASPQEAALWRKLRGNRVAGLHFRRQQVINGHVVDFYCHAAALVVEVDANIGTFHARHKDKELTRLGLRVIRVPNEDVHRDIDGVMRRIKRAVAKPSSGG